MSKSSANEQQIQEFIGAGPEAPRVRLCGFATGKSQLLPGHETWLRQHVLPILSGGTVTLIRLRGLASRIGSSALNYRLSIERANAVKRFLERESRKSINMDVNGYGEARSGSNEKDNNPFFRAVDVYIYETPIPPPDPKIAPPVPCAGTMYIGIGIKGGGMLGIAGYQYLYGWLYSSDDYDDSCSLEAMVGSFGVGLGAGVNFVFLIGHGAVNNIDFKGTHFDGWSVAVSLGAKWGDVVKGIKSTPALLRILPVIKNGPVKGTALKTLLRLSKSEWKEMSQLANTIGDALNIDPCGSSPKIDAIDIPFAGIALEVSLTKWWARVTAVY
ncbi:MAG: OmpA family protein [Pirellulales bacterium]